MESRKLQSVGNRSYSVSLPKSWVKGNGLKQKDLVFVEQASATELLISSRRHASGAKSLMSLRIEDLDNIAEFIVFCYVKNINKVVLKYSKPDYDKVAEVRRVLHYLDGYDITSEDENHIEISFLFKDVNVTLPQIIRRMIYILKLAISSLEKNDSESMEEAEANIDRLYNLSKRILFGCAGNHSIRTANGLANDEDLFFMKDIFKKLEQIGDNFYRLKNAKLSKQEISFLKRSMEFVGGMVFGQIQPSALKESLHSIKTPSSKNETGANLDKIHERCRDILENFISIYYNRKYFSE